MSDLIERTYEASIDDLGQVYDGDTIERVRIKIPSLKGDPKDAGQIYPEIYVDKFDGSVYIEVAVRLAGIDCPERHPRKRLPDGSMRSPDEVAHEMQLAWQARAVVTDMIAEAKFQFEVRNPQIGKYASRIVGEVWVQQTKSTPNVLTNLSDLLIAKGLAKPYDGGTKERWTTEDGELEHDVIPVRRSIKLTGREEQR